MFYEVQLAPTTNPRIYKCAYHLVKKNKCHRNLQASISMNRSNQFRNNENTILPAKISM